MGHCHRHDGGRGAGDLQPAHIPVSPHRPSVHRHHLLLPGGFGGDCRKQRDSDHRAEDDRLRQDAVHVGDERFVRIIPHRVDLRPGHRSGPRLGAGAEQAPARHGEPAGGGAAPGHQGEQKHPKLSDGCRPDLGRRAHGRQRLAGLCPIQPGEGALKGAGGGRGGDFRQPVRHARLAQPQQVDRLPDDGPGRRHGASGLQRRGLRRAVRRGAGGEGPAPQCRHHRPEHAQDARGVCGDPSAYQPRRLHRAGQGCGTDGTRDRVLRHPGLLQRQALRRAGHPAGRRRQCPGYGRCGQGQVGGDESFFPRRHEGYLPLRHHPLRQGGHQ